MRERKPVEIIDRWLASTDESNDGALHPEPLQNNPKGQSNGEDSDELELALPGLEEYRSLIVQDPSYMWILIQLHRETITTETEESLSHEIRKARLHATWPTKHSMTLAV
ncbi:hypothetical protein CIB48_g12031 [Xylaria polymorpha]|nr:hypothetical protein CIB48_g12031 [Xylaria polymorpha]